MCVCVFLASYHPLLTPCSIDEEEYGGHMELLMDGFYAASAMFLVGAMATTCCRPTAHYALYANYAVMLSHSVHAVSM